MISYCLPSLMAFNTLKNRNCNFQLGLTGLWAFGNITLSLTQIFISNAPLTSRRVIFPIYKTFVLFLWDNTLRYLQCRCLLKNLHYNRSLKWSCSLDYSQSIISRGWFPIDLVNIAITWTRFRVYLPISLWYRRQVH